MGNDIARYKAAVGRRNVGSDPSRATMQHAKDTAIGRNKPNGITTKVGSVAAGSGMPHGSMAGYKNSPSTLLLPNGAGYSNPSSQKARYKERVPGDFSHGTNVGKVLSRSFPRNVTDMTRTGSKWNSASILEKNMRLNDMFK